MKQDTTYCQQRIDACQQLMSCLVTVEALYEGFPFESMNRALADVRSLLQYQQVKLRNILSVEELNSLSQARLYSGTPVRSRI